MSLFNSNSPKFLDRDLYDLNDLGSKIFLNNYCQDIPNSNNFYSKEKTVFINDNSINFLTESEKQSENNKINEIISNHISCSDSEVYDNISINAKEQELIDKAYPLKKQKIFKVEYSNNSTIFNFGIYDNYSNQMIYEALKEPNKCYKNVKKSMKLFTQIPKKPKKKRTKIIQQRKQNSDNIRKKIKARFLKSLKNEINKKLKKAGSKYIFCSLPQSFICNLSKKLNKQVLNMSLKEILEKNFCDGKKDKKIDLKKYNHNLFVLKYLETNKEICEKSNFNIIQNKKYSQIFNEYLESKAFGLEISILKQEKENEKYIKDYIVRAKNFLYFFNN